jgi:hypothetical protein
VGVVGGVDGAGVGGVGWGGEVGVGCLLGGVGWAVSGVVRGGSGRGVTLL